MKKLSLSKWTKTNKWRLRKIKIRAEDTTIAYLMVREDLQLHKTIQDFMLSDLPNKIALIIRTDLQAN